MHVLTPSTEILAQLQQALIEEWDNIPQRCIAEKVLSMNRRSVIDVQVGHTGYKLCEFRNLTL